MFQSFLCTFLRCLVFVPVEDNLLLNGGFDTGDFSNWTKTGIPQVVSYDLFPVPMGPPCGTTSSYCFYGGSGPTGPLQTSAEQEIMVSSYQNHQFSLDADLGGWRNARDLVWISLKFRSSTMDSTIFLNTTHVLESVSSCERKGQSMFIHRSVQGVIPFTAEVALVVVTAMRTAGQFTDAYVDNIRFVVSPSKYFENCTAFLGLDCE